MDSSFPQLPKQKATLSLTTAKVSQKITQWLMLLDMGVLANCALAKSAEQSVALGKRCTEDHQMRMHSTKSILAATELYQCYFPSYQHKSDTSGQAQKEKKKKRKKVQNQTRNFPWFGITQREQKEVGLADQCQNISDRNQQDEELSSKTELVPKLLKDNRENSYLLTKLHLRVHSMVKEETTNTQQKHPARSGKQYPNNRYQLVSSLCKASIHRLILEVQSEDGIS